MSGRRSSGVTLPPFQTLLDHHTQDVHRFLVAAVGAVEAEDCFQETFLSALRAYPRLRDASNLRGWLLTIANRKAIDAHRARARRPLPVEEVPERPSQEAERSDPELWQAVRRLPGKQRAAVLLRFAGDMAYEQIGAALGCSEVAARQNVRAGLATIRKGWGTA
jgi:RNA polymerase sigma factor (sigma-70 family)